MNPARPGSGRDQPLWARCVFLWHAWLVINKLQRLGCWKGMGLLAPRSVNGGMSVH